MNYTEQQKKKQEILKRIQAQQQLEQQRAKQKEFGLDDVINTGKTINEQGNNLNSLSKGASRLGKTLSKSNHKVISGIGNRLQTVGDFGQKITGEPLKQRISGAIKNKLGIGTPKTPVTPTAQIPGTTPTGLEMGGSAGVGGGSLAGSAMTGGSTAGSSAIGSAIGSQVAGTAGATGGSALTSALGAELAGTAAGAGAAGTGSAIGSAISAAAPSAMAGTAAGAGAAGAGAAGAAGAGAGAAALGALGPVGAALAAGYMIYSMIKSAKKKQQAKQMQISSQAAEEGAQQAAVKKANAMQNLQAQTPQAPQVQPTVEAPEMPLPQPEQVVQEQPQEDSSVMDIMQLIPGGTEGADVPDAEAMPTSLPESPEVEAPQLEAPQIEPTALEGTPTGFAANVTPEATKASLMNRIKARAGNVGSAVQSGLNKFSSGLSDFNAGYQDNARTSLTEGDLYKRIMPDTSEQAGETQTEDGAYVLSANEKKKKNLMNRIGEAAGTAHRIAANPLTQGSIAGLAYAKSEDDPLYGLGKGVEWAQGKAKSDYYQKKVNPNSLPSIFGGYSEKDYNADTLSKYRDTMAENNTMRAELEREKQAAKERNDQAEIQHKKDSLAETKRYHDAQIKRWSQGKGNVDMEMIEEMIRRGYRLEDGVWVK